jgi:hypothetical protein
MVRTAAMATATTSPRRPVTTGPDRITMLMLTLAAFLAILALLAWQVRAAPARPARHMVVLRRVYETRVVESVIGAARGRSSVTQSVSRATPASSVSTAPTTCSS